MTQALSDVRIVEIGEIVSAPYARLLVQADILIDNVPPPEMDRIGLGFERLRRVNPSLIMTSVSPFGLNGPYLR